METMHTFTFTKNNINFSVAVVAYWCNNIFFDSWEMTNNHQGGVTVQNPDADHNSYKYAIPLNYSLNERVKDLIAQGVENPCAAAYAAAQKELRRDFSASEYGFQVTAECNGYKLLDGETIGCCFDYSYHDAEDLEDTAQEVFDGNGIADEALEAAQAVAREMIANIEALKAAI